MTGTKNYEVYLFKVYCPNKKATDLRQFSTPMPAGEVCPICHKAKGKKDNQCDFTLERQD